MLLNKTICECGEDLKDKTFSNFTPNEDIRYYGGNCQMFGEIDCKCGRKLKGIFKRLDDGKLKLIDLEVIHDVENKKTDISNFNNEPIKDTTQDEKIENTQTSLEDNKTDEEKRQELYRYGRKIGAKVMPNMKIETIREKIEQVEKNK